MGLDNGGKSLFVPVISQYVWIFALEQKFQSLVQNFHFVPLAIYVG